MTLKTHQGVNFPKTQRRAAAPTRDVIVKIDDDDVDDVDGQDDDGDAREWTTTRAFDRAPGGRREE